MENADAPWWWRGREGSELKGSSAVAAAVVAVLIGFYFVTRRKKEKLGLPPGLRGLPVVGSLPFLRSDVHVWFKELADTYGSVFSLRLGSRFCVVLSSPEAVKEALKDQDAIFANHDVPAAALDLFYGGRDIAWAPYGPFWRMVRKVAVRELLSPTSIDGLCDLRRAPVRRMEDDLRRSAGRPFNLRELVSTAAMNMTTEMLWGGSVAQDDPGKEALETEFRESITQVNVLFGALNISDYLPILAGLDLQGLGRRARKLAAWLDHIFNRIIEARLKKIDAKRDFLQVLLDLSQNPDPEAPMTMDVVKALLLDLVTGGTDTSSITVEWVMAELLRRPEKMKIAMEEVRAVVGDGAAVEEAHIPRLRYIGAVVRETLRLHPAVPLLGPRCTSSSCTIAGYRIPKGSKVFFNMWAIQRDPRLWEDASELKPERFLGEAGAADYAKSFRYLPFGAGRRICVGVPLAERMMVFLVASLLHSADWALPGGGPTELDMKEKFGSVVRKEKALVAIPVPW